MYAKCTKCRLDWNISTKTDLSKPYICPKCTKRKLHPRKVTKEHKDLVRNVLLRNKNKFGGI